MPQIGSTQLTFGVSDESFGLFENLEVDKTSEKAEAMNGNGAITDVQFFQIKQVITGSYLVIGTTITSSDPFAKVGSGTVFTLTDSISPGDIYVDNAKISRTKDGFVKIDFTGTFYPDLAA